MSSADLRDKLDGIAQTAKGGYMNCHDLNMYIYININTGWHCSDCQGRLHELP